MAPPRTIDREPLEDALEAVGVYEGLRSYSGRGMYGDECVAFSCENIRDAFGFFVALGEQEPETAAMLARVAATDDMGLGMVVYFPGFTVEGLDEEDDEEE